MRLTIERETEIETEMERSPIVWKPARELFNELDAVRAERDAALARARQLEEALRRIANPVPFGSEATQAFALVTIAREALRGQE